MKKVVALALVIVLALVLTITPAEGSTGVKRLGYRCTVDGQLQYGLQFSNTTPKVRHFNWRTNFGGQYDIDGNVVSTPRNESTGTTSVKSNKTKQVWLPVVEQDSRINLSVWSTKTQSGNRLLNISLATPTCFD